MWGGEGGAEAEVGGVEEEDSGGGDGGEKGEVVNSNAASSVEVSIPDLTWAVPVDEAAVEEEEEEEAEEEEGEEEGGEAQAPAEEEAEVGGESQAAEEEVAVAVEGGGEGGAEGRWVELGRWCFLCDSS